MKISHNKLEVKEITIINIEEGLKLFVSRKFEDVEKILRPLNNPILIDHHALLLVDNDFTCAAPMLFDIF